MWLHRLLCFMTWRIRLALRKASMTCWMQEMSYMPLMLRMNSFDTICHEHLEYYSLSVLKTIMERASLRIFRVSLNWINGGSIRCYVCKADCFRYDTTEARDLIRRLQVNE